MSSLLPNRVVLNAMQSNLISSNLRSRLIFNAVASCWFGQGDAELIVTKLVPGMPADACGKIRVLDRLVSVGDTSVLGCEIGEACRMIKGRPSSSSSLPPPQACFAHNPTCEKPPRGEHCQHDSPRQSFLMLTKGAPSRPGGLHCPSSFSRGRCARPCGQALQCRFGKAQARRQPCRAEQ